MPIATPEWPIFKEVLRRQGLMDDMMERRALLILKMN